VKRLRETNRSVDLLVQGIGCISMLDTSRAAQVQDTGGHTQRLASPLLQRRSANRERVAHRRQFLADGNPFSRLTVDCQRSVRRC